MAKRGSPGLLVTYKYLRNAGNIHLVRIKGNMCRYLIPQNKKSPQRSGGIKERRSKSE